MKPIFICLVAWEDGRDKAYPSQSDMARFQQRARQMLAANGSVLGSISSALRSLFLR